MEPAVLQRTVVDRKSVPLSDEITINEGGAYRHRKQADKAGIEVYENGNLNLERRQRHPGMGAEDVTAPEGVFNAD